MSQTALTPASSRPGPRQIAIIALAVVSGLVHLYRAILMFGLMGAGRVGRPPGGRPGGVGGGRPPGGGGPSIMSMLPVPLPTLFLLNFVGYIVLAIAFYLPALQRYRQIIRWVLIVYAAITIILWFLFTGGRFDFIGYGDKIFEIALIVLLLIDSREPAPAND
ncbi:hypothetical protein [Reticulibacter mediterranei]|nr:hypothetical protein [Reticulibacter mediterranei]